MPLSRLYARLMGLRACAYKKGLLKSQKPTNFCVSVGNIAWGGSGKTPIADWLLTWARQKGLTSALLSRGYGGESEERPLLVKAHTTVEASGDEPLMLARRHHEAYILADPKRRRALDWVQAQTTANFIVLDDGMQHLAIERDLNLILLRLSDLEENWGKVIPGGEWREGVCALKRASAFLLRLSPEDFKKEEERIRTRLSQFAKPIFSFSLRPCGLSPLGEKAEKIHGPGGLLPGLNGHPYALCTGVGSPESVLESAKTLLGSEPGHSFIYPDHHKFTAQDLKKMATTGRPIVMTAKDAVKIQALLLQESTAECYVLESEVLFGPRVATGPDFPAWLEERWHELN